MHRAGIALIQSDRLHAFLVQMSGFVATLIADFRSKIPLVAWVVLTLTVGISGPFGSYVALDLPARLLFWGVISAMGIGVGAAIRAFVHAVIGLSDLQRGAFLVALLSSVIMTLPLHALADRMFDPDKATAPDLPDIALFIFATSLGIGAFRHARESRPDDVASPLVPILPDLPASETETVPPPRVVQRLDPELHGRLVALTVRDHYVDVFTVRGKGSLLMRFADAMAETGEEEGVQIHRSHWVALWAIKGVEREGGRIWVRMCPELRLPVSRTHRVKLEERGLL
ncbi:hypothetical protein GCM10007291_33800 [Gemmobacter nanjingensis]|uniref:HTH LytTR-type domain-containing protein n=2 Tax=Gemmobacter nanjingensis TaxID=488454 RepID=A0ABQ3FMX4_9RHOB|nr:hypothetical protein GCM10007291_33800 [Gemmobacter nanjingensis]